MAKSITYVGLDVHKDTIAVALAEAGLRGEVREHGKIPNTPAALKALTVKLAPAGRELRFCYEAGPCGYGIQRQLTGAGHECTVVAPSLIPRKPGLRIKTDRPGRSCTGAGWQVGNDPTGHIASVPIPRVSGHSPLQGSRRHRSRPRESRAVNC